MYSFLFFMYHVFTYGHVVFLVRLRCVLWTVLEDPLLENTIHVCFRDCCPHSLSLKVQELEV